LISLLLLLVLGVQKAKPWRKRWGATLGRPPKKGSRLEPPAVAARVKVDELEAELELELEPGAGRGKSMTREIRGSELEAVGRVSGIDGEGMNDGRRLPEGVVESSQG
jgi:hypothetical protein